MAKGNLTVRVSKPPDEVFPFVADLENAPQWVPDLVSITKITVGEVGVGTRYREVVKMGNKHGEAELEVTQYDPPRVFGHRGRGGPSHFSARYSLEPAEGGTRIRHDYTVRLSGFFWLFSPLINRWVRKNTAVAMNNLKKAIDGN